MKWCSSVVKAYCVVSLIVLVFLLLLRFALNSGVSRSSEDAGALFKNSITLESGSPAISVVEGKNAGDRLELAGTVYRWCPPGVFTMGSPEEERGRHRDEDQVNVTLTKGFWLGETEVTEGQWRKLMEIST